MNSSLICFSETTIGFKKAQKTLFSNFSGAIHEGDFVGILGANGTGKSTLFKVLLGIIPSLSGKLTLFGKPPGSYPHRIGYVPQTWSVPTTILISGKTLLEAIQQGTKLGIPWITKTQRIEIEEVLERVGARTYAEEPFWNLSGGEQQRIMLAQALLGSPDLLLLDEPLSALDKKSQKSFLEILYSLRQNENKTILLISHDIHPLKKIINKILFLENGKAILGSYDSIIDTVPKKELYCLHQSPGNYAESYD